MCKASSGHTLTTKIPLFWAAYGNPEGRPLLLLHGGPGAHHDYLLPQMLALSPNRRLVFYDQRGGGRSRDESRAAIGWRTHVEDLADVAEELQVHPLDIVGYSWGGLLALLYAVEARNLAHGPTGKGAAPPSRLVLVDPVPASSQYRRMMSENFQERQNRAAIRAARSALTASGLRDSDPELYRQRLFELSVAGYFKDPAAARSLTPFRVTGRVQDSVWQSLGEYDLMPSLAQLSLPALVIHGRDDPIPLQSSVEVADALHARLVVLDDCGHVPYVEQPDALFAAIERFLADTNELPEQEQR
jgi:proline iminopeptidase